MRVIVAGSRGVTDYQVVSTACANSGFNFTEVISGTARGVDTLGERYAFEIGVPVAIFPPDWDTLGKGAGFVRNKEMADRADALVAVWDGVSKGTAHMISVMQSQQKPVFIYNIKKEEDDKE